MGGGGGGGGSPLKLSYRLVNKCLTEYFLFLLVIFLITIFCNFCFELYMPPYLLICLENPILFSNKTWGPPLIEMSGFTSDTCILILYP